MLWGEGRRPWDLLKLGGQGGLLEDPTGEEIASGQLNEKEGSVDVDAREHQAHERQVHAHGQSPRVL